MQSTWSYTVDGRVVRTSSWHNANQIALVKGLRQNDLTVFVTVDVSATYIEVEGEAGAWWRFLCESCETARQCQYTAFHFISQALFILKRKSLS